MFFGAFQAMSGFARCVAGLLCCLFCGGPVLIIIGIALLSSPNDRSGDVAEYNRAVEAYNRGDGPILATTTMNVFSLPLTQTQPAISITGSSDGVNDATHYVFSRTDSAFGGATQWPVSIQTPATNATLTWNVAWMKTVSKELRCDSSRCTSNCRADNDGIQCSSSSMRSYCENQFLGSYTDNGEACYGNEVCGSCLFSGTLSRACVVVSLSGGSVTKSSQYASCYYPFNEYDYAPSTGAVTFQVMTETDPFITLQRLTDGSNDFGVSAAQQRRAGIACLVVGIVLTIGVGSAGYCMYRRRQKKQKEQPPTVVITHHNVGQQPVYGQPVYGEPPQHQGYPMAAPVQQGYHPNAAYQGGYPMHQFPPPPQYTPVTERPPQYGKPM